MFLFIFFLFGLLFCVSFRFFVVFVSFAVSFLRLSHGFFSMFQPNACGKPHGGRRRAPNGLGFRASKITAALGGPLDGRGIAVDGNQKSGKLGISKNNGTPKSSIFIGFSLINHPFWGTPIFGNTQLTS